MNQQSKQFESEQTKPTKTNPTYDSSGMKGVLTREQK